MAKVVGKDLEFWFGGVEVPVESVGLGTAFDTVENTDSATETTGKDYDVIRAARTFTVEANLYAALGNEITGDGVSTLLTAGVRYQVTLGWAIQGDNNFLLGQIFTADGTEVLGNAVDKVKPLGAKINGKDMSFSLVDAEVPVVDMDFSVKFDELDVTDTSSTGDSKEVVTSRGDRETKVTGIVSDSVADSLTTAPVSQACVLTFGTGNTVTGNVVLTAKNITDAVSDVAKIDYTAKWIGTPVEVLMGLVAGTSAAFKVILKPGTSTNKEYTGTAVLISKTVKASVTSGAKISYSFSVTGAQTEAVAN